LTHLSALWAQNLRLNKETDLLEVFGRIIDLAKKEAVDIILISGDLYEHEYVRKSTIHYINKKFSEIPETKVFIVPGNHDPCISNSYYQNFEWSKKCLYSVGEQDESFS